MIYDFFCENLNFLNDNLNFLRLYENLRFFLWKILMIFSMIFLRIHKISYYKVRVCMGSLETRWLGGSFWMVYKNNAGRLGSRYITVCLETRLLDHLGGFYVPEWPCNWTGLNCLRQTLYISTLTLIWITERNKIDTLAVTFAVQIVFMYSSIPKP